MNLLDKLPGGYKAKYKQKRDSEFAVPFFYSRKDSYLFAVGATRNLRASRITITKASAITTSPGRP